MRYTNEAIKKRKSRESKVKKNFNFIIYIILLPILIYNIFLIIQAILKPNETPSFFGIKTYVIISGSMQPELNIGDIVIVKKVNQNELKIGDIISYRQGQTIITHRISEIIKKDKGVEYKTKGDNNNVEDSGVITYDTIEGKVVNDIAQIGNIAIILKSRGNIIIIIILLYIYLIFSGNIRKKKMQRKIKRQEYENKIVEEQYGQKK